MAETKAPNKNAEQLITEHLDIWTTAIEQKSSSGRGSSKKFSLHGIKKLRELILELAVRGKLVSQDPNDEPASVLLERIADEKAQLVKDKKIKKPKAQPAISEDEKPFELPKGWAWSRLQDIGHDLGQKAPDSEFTYIDVGSINKELGFVSEPNILKGEDAPSRARKIVKENTVIYSTIRPYLLNIAVIDKEFQPEPIASTAFAIIHPLSGLNSSYIYRYLRAPTFIGYVESVQTGVAYPAINDKQFFAGIIPIPPTKEQKRIVTKVDELMDLCDALEAQTENSIAAHQTLVEVLLDALLQAPEQNATSEQATVQFQQNWQRLSEHFDTLFTTTASIDTLKQTILQLAVMGKLVPQNPVDEPAGKLLERIAAEKAQLIKDKKIKKQKPLPEILDEEKLYELPSGWVWSRFGDLFKSFSNGLYKPSKFYTDEGVISLRMYNIQNGYIDFAGAKRVEVESNELAQFILEPNDLLINRVNSKELVGKTAIIPKSEEPLVYESMNMRAKPFIEHLSAQYLNLFMMTKAAQNFISSFAKEAVGQASINQGQVSSIIIPLPPFKEQQRIVTKIDELMTLCDQLKARLTNAQTTKLYLTDAIVENSIN
ncbi:restriction endonuclease subunit S [Pseudoalteromonas sp. APC 3355]|uniref:restriction endonuclease subunit S n=1 Tax=Pseudoalteromonas sp. APC 3355 TaxID=3035199 RepID=UPI0025B329DD|nr:restriction endonuclease subunit S [Pseudoalteromonas sp. APC 3355]MDN3473974.1 restriction endonuclease subunit S [Pseudoalteromonas sp. APC 3355]